MLEELCSSEANFDTLIVTYEAASKRQYCANRIGRGTCFAALDLEGDAAPLEPHLRHAVMHLGCIFIFININNNIIIIITIIVVINNIIIKYYHYYIIINKIIIIIIIESRQLFIPHMW